MTYTTTLHTQLYVRMTLYSHEKKHLHERIVSLREDVWANKTALTLLLVFFIEVNVPSQQVSDHVYIRVLGVSSSPPVATLSRLYFGTVLTAWYFLSSSFFKNI